MKKFLLLIFILFDLIIILASGAFLYTRLMSGQSPLMMKNPLAAVYPSKSPMTPPSASNNVTTASSTVSSPPLAMPAVATQPMGTTRKIGFAYRNSKARKVLLRGDFTGWKGEPMSKDAAGVWKYTAVLDPGEYGYLYSVDDTQKLDPANKKTKKIGNTTVSAITVQPPAAPH